MMRIAVFQFGYETNTFIDGQAEFKDLGVGGWITGDKFWEIFRGKRTGVSGILAALEENDAQAVPIGSISRAGAFNAGPTISKDCIKDVVNHICSELREKENEYDGVCCAMHGAGVAEGCEDVDGFLLCRIREVIGDKPIMASLDIHANISPEMVRLTDGIFGIKTNPHVDFYDASYRAAKTIIGKISGTCCPKMAMRRLPLLISSCGGSTMGGAAKEVKEHYARYAEEHGLVDASFFQGFFGTDSKYTSAAVVVVADGYSPEKEADELADYVWARREKFNSPVYSAEDAVNVALSALKDRYVVINEGSDNPGAGCPGDGTHLLREFIRRDIPGTIMGPVRDGAAAAECHRHYVGDRFRLNVGGKTLPVYGEPLELEVELLALSDGDFVCASPVHKGALMSYGPSARLRCRNVEFIVVTNLMQVYDDRPFIMTGANMADYRIVGLKSTNHFRAYFSQTADALIGADTPCTCPADLHKIPYQKVIRPIYPLDANTEYNGIWP